MKTQTEYKILTAGEIRTEGDEWRSVPYKKTRLIDTNSFNWQAVKHLLGFSILASDLIHLEFRRPV